MAVGHRNFRLDETVSPCVDFFQYANGAWLERNPILPERSSMSVGVEIQEHNFEVLRGILEAAAEAAFTARAEGSQQKVGDFFSAAMDEGRLTELGTTPLEPDLERIESVNSLGELSGVVTEFHSKATRSSSPRESRTIRKTPMSRSSTCFREASGSLRRT